MAVDRGRAGEDEPRAVWTHGFKDLQEATNVVAIVFQGLAHRFSHGFQRGEVDYGEEGSMGLEQLIHKMRVGAVPLLEWGSEPAEGLDAF